MALTPFTLAGFHHACAREHHAAWRPGVPFICPGDWLRLTGVGQGTRMANQSIPASAVPFLNPSNSVRFCSIASANSPDGINNEAKGATFIGELVASSTASNSGSITSPTSPRLRTARRHRASIRATSIVILRARIDARWRRAVRNLGLVGDVIDPEFDAVLDATKSPMNVTPFASLLMPSEYSRSRSSRIERSWKD